MQQPYSARPAMASPRDATPRSQSRSLSVRAPRRCSATPRHRRRGPARRRTHQARSPRRLGLGNDSHPRHPWSGALAQLPEIGSPPRRSRAARVIAVADSFDAVTLTHEYKPAEFIAQTLETLEPGAASAWDYEIVLAFITEAVPHLMRPGNLMVSLDGSFDRSLGQSEVHRVIARRAWTE